jgi:DNA topoisomerase-1
MDTLIIAEKPSVALRIAIALGSNNQRRLVSNGVSYYEISEAAGKIYIAAAVGHLFTIRQADKAYGYPVLNVEWSASYEVNKSADFTKKYLDVFKLLAPKAKRFINACDFDIEGTVIGTNIIKFVGGSLESARRMKFSTTTTPDLKEAYANLMPMDMNNFYAGEARHILDWLWGINLSRALTSALSKGRFSKSLSIGRVQGPSLALLAKREIDIGNFKPKPFWRVVALIGGTEFANTKGDIFDKAIADKALQTTNQNMSNGIVAEVDPREQLIRPYPPFDLTSLQVEASRTLRMDPSATLATAQSLYERAYISYPRTSSQKLPQTLGLSRIIADLAKNPAYEGMAKKLIAEKRFRPNEGMKSDEAHPAIFPTGTAPKGLTDIETKLYDLIARRFLACFAAYAKTANMRVVAQFGDEHYSASGTSILEKGWLDFYPYATINEKTLPAFVKGATAKASKVYTQDMQTQPPRRYTKAGLISELEKHMLGTKATRASIIDTLFKREYIEGTSIRVTKFGMSVYEALNENANMIVNEGTTRRLEEDMEKISKGEKSANEVIEEGKGMLLEALKTFDSNKAKIAEEMTKGISESEEILGKCPTDGGNLLVRKSKMGKSFAACSNYPNCTTTYSLPQNALVVGTGKTCEHCHTPIVKVIRSGKGVFEMDLDPNCITKKAWKEKAAARAEKAAGAALAAQVKTAAQIKKENAANIAVKAADAAVKTVKDVKEAKKAAKAGAKKKAAPKRKQKVSKEAKTIGMQ